MPIGTTHSCALISGGSVRCWGDNFWGQSGNGTGADSATPVFVSAIGNAAEIVSGYSHACARLDDGAVKCWGRNGAGRLGNGTVTTKELAPVSVINLLDNVATMEAGAGMGCVVLANKTAQCWGGNNLGQLGDGTDTNRLNPVFVNGLNNVSQVIAGNARTCALIGSGSDVGKVKCWGENSNGQLGDGSNINRLTPVFVHNLENVSFVSYGNNHACALIGGGAYAGKVKCWGDNYNGQLGDGTNINRYVPTFVVGLQGVAKLSLGTNYSCAVISTGADAGKMKCWGLNTFAQLGDGTFQTKYKPVYFLATTDVILSSSSGYFHQCYVNSSSQVACIGNTLNGQSGYDENFHLPRNVSGF